jgi:hypothetical protein
VTGSLSTLDEVLNVAKPMVADAPNLGFPAVLPLSVPILPSFSRTPNVGDSVSAPVRSGARDVVKVFFDEPIGVGEFTIAELIKRTGWSNEFVTEFKVRTQVVMPIIVTYSQQTEKSQSDH